jgi:hypothetical protein
MSREPKPVCAVCGMGGYWVAYDPQTEEQRCVNHIGFDTFPDHTNGSHDAR